MSAPDFWEQRYETQHRTVHRMEDTIAALRADLLKAEEALQAIDLRPTMARDYVRRYFTDRAALSPKGQPE